MGRSRAVPHGMLVILARVNCCNAALQSRRGFQLNVEIIVSILGGRAGAKTGHADENPILADDRVRALTDSCFDPDAHGRIANDLWRQSLSCRKKKVMQGT